MRSDCTPVVMHARVLESEQCRLLVCDVHTRQQVLVHADNACRFCPGDCVCIRFSGAMTNSIPPQISADSVCCMEHN